MKTVWKLEIDGPSNDSFGTTALVTAERNGRIVHFFSAPNPRPDYIKAMRAIVRAANAAAVIPPLVSRPTTRTSK